MKLTCRLLAAIILCAAGARAETATNIVNGVTVNHSETYYYVGNTGPFNVLIVTNAGRLNCMPGGVSHIGKNESSDNNSAVVTGAGSYWRTGYLNLGLNGAGNSLTITNGGVVDTSGTYVGYETNAANNRLIVTGPGSRLTSESSFMFGEKGQDCQLTISNGGRINVDENACLGKDLLVDVNGHAVANNASALVTGSGSIWSISNELYVGMNGVGNQLTIAAGGEVLDTTGYLGLASDSDNQNNRVDVTGANSKWINSGWLVVGDTTSGNHLTVTNGGFVVNANGSLGNSADPEGHSADNNTVLVTGSGSVWSNTGSLYVGRMGDGNSVTISNEGAVFVAGDAFISYDALAENNQFTLAGGSLTLTNAGAGTLEVRHGSLNVNGGTLKASRLVMTNNTADGGNRAFLNFNYGTLNVPDGVQIVAPAGNDLIIGNTAGQTATWNMSSGTNSILPVISNTFNTVIGGSAGATGKVLVTGAATVFTNAGTLEVRHGSLTLDGGVLGVNTLLATNNTAGATNAFFNFNHGVLSTVGAQIVVPAGSNFIVGTTVGQTATWNMPGGTNSIQPVTGKTAAIYLGVTGVTANVLVQDPGTLWTNGCDLVVGHTSGGNLLTITNGAEVFNNLAIIGNQGSASNNFGLVTGGGSVWRSSSALVIGNSGAGNTLTIANTGRVVSLGGFIGYNTSASNSTVLVTGSGSVWTNIGDLTLANDGSGNSLILTNGGHVGVAGNGYIGYHFVAHDNTATITGTDSVWNTSGYLAVGYSGFENQLAIANGGVVRARDAYAGISASGSNNNILITDSGSGLNLATNLYLGYGSVGNTLTITNGGTLSVGGDAYVGFNAGANGNAALVTGSGSVWSNTGTLYVGSNSVGNTLSVLDSGCVVSATCYIGFGTNACHNAVLVAGSGSLCSNKGYLMVGYAGAGNTLTITNGGTVHDNRCHMGNNASSSNNAALITGAGSVWTHGSDIRVGMASVGNTLTIIDQGAMYSAGGSVGMGSNAYNNALLVTGAFSVWSNSGTCTVGSSGASNQMTITDGGTVINDRAVIGATATASNNLVLVTGANSIWDNGSYLFLGNLGSGNQLTISNGGTVSADSVILGNSDGSSNNTLIISGGTLSVTNPVNDGLDVRRGTLTFNGGLIVASQFCANNGVSSVVNFNGGTINTKAMTIANGSPFTVGDGTSAAVLSLHGETNNFADGLVISTAAQMSGAATINASVTSGGIVAPGESVGVMTVQSNYTQNAGGALAIEVGGPSSLGAGTGFDQLNGSGAADLAGALNVTLLNGYSPAINDTYTIVLAGARTGEFATKTLPALGGGLAWNMQYNSDGVVLSVIGGYNAWASGITNTLTNWNQCATGDGYPNLLKYATGSSPTESDKLAGMDCLSTGGLFALKFNRNTNAVDVTLFVEGADSATDSATWTGISTNIAGAWSPTNIVTETGAGSPVSVTVQDTAANATNRFMRVRVISP